MAFVTKHWLLGEHDDEGAGVMVVVGVGVGVELPPVVVDMSEELLVSGRLSRLARCWWRLSCGCCCCCCRPASW